jgi:hypothetical protein
MIVYLVMSVLGTAIGASLLAPMSKPDPLQGFGFGSGVWVIITTVLAVFVGSYYAGRCAPVLGWLHGLLAWAVMTLFILYGMTSLITGAVSTAGSVAATGAQVGAQVGATAANQAGGANSIVDTAKQQMQSAMASAASMASSPEAGQRARETADTAARGVARASWFSFAALIVGAIIAIVSGSAGFRHQPPIEESGGSAVGRNAVPGSNRVVSPRSRA